MKKYRKCVVGVIQDNEGFVLIGERSTSPGSWQFPQGGVDKEEDDHTAVLRELWEEVGAKNLELKKRLEETVSYDFPEEIKARTKIGKKYFGQVQRWFLFTTSQRGNIDLERATDKGFTRLKWVQPLEALEAIMEWKEEAYKEALSGLGLL